MPEFVLIDLNTQAESFIKYVHGLKLEQILQLLHQNGTVKKVAHPDDNQSYLFRSTTGITTGFRFTEEEQMIILRDHSTYAR